MPRDDESARPRSPSQPLDAALELLMDAMPRGDDCSHESASDPAELLLHRGWLGLFCRVADLSQQVAVLVSTRTPRASIRLNQIEYGTLVGMARGSMVKHLACELGASEASIRAALGRVLQKFNLGSSSQLPAVWRALTGRATEVPMGSGKSVLLFSCELSPRGAPLPLTAAENEIVRGIIAGSSNRVLALQRGTSERTIANQVAGLLRKFGVASRRELIAQLLARRT